MAILTQWYDKEKNIIQQIYSSTWTVDEFLHTLHTTRSMIFSQTHTVHIFVCFAGKITLPRDFLYTLRHMEKVKAQNTGMCVIVGGGSFVHSMYDIIRHIIPCQTCRVQIAETLDAAEAIIAEMEDIVLPG